MEQIRAHVFIKGRVQGVFYRAWTKDEASNLGLSGWVRNLADGRVEAVFEGSKKNVKKMISECKKGSNIANVEHIDVNWEKATGEFKKFRVLATEQSSLKIQLEGRY